MKARSSCSLPKRLQLIPAINISERCANAANTDAALTGYGTLLTRHVSDCHKAVRWPLDNYGLYRCMHVSTCQRDQLCRITEIPVHETYSILPPLKIEMWPPQQRDKRAARRAGKSRWQQLGGPVTPRMTALLEDQIIQYSAHI